MSAMCFFLSRPSKKRFHLYVNEYLKELKKLEFILCDS
jgi:hypothetical protein